MYSRLVQLAIDEKLLDGFADEGLLEGEVDAEARDALVSVQKWW